MTNTNLFKKIASLFLCLALLLPYLPFSPARAQIGSGVPAETLTDPGTAHTWESMMGTAADGNRYAGRVWVDKSVYQNGDTVLLNTRGESTSSLTAQLEEDEAFQIVFSALGSTMSTRKTVSSSGPLDVVLVLDTSTSMDDTNNNVTRLERVIQAANNLLSDLNTIPGVRIAIVTYNRDSETVVPLAERKNGLKLVVTNYYNNGQAGAGVVTAYDDSGNKLGNDSGYTQGTNLQAGIDRGFRILAEATDVEGRVPVAIVLTDGQANRANRSSFYSGIGSGNSASDERLFLSTLLNAAYNKALVEANYGVEQTVYGIGVDLGNNATAHALMNPGDPTNRGFNSSNTTEDIRNAYGYFQNWSQGNTVNIGSGNSRWTFDHGYPNLGGAITDSKIASNIHYVDTYFDVSSAELEDAFQQIYEELSSGAFNPISSSTTVSGGTGVENTPLIYVDFIGQHMEVKEIQSVSLFGASYGVTANGDGTYTVAPGTGSNPTTGEAWNTSEDIRISVTRQEDGTQKLEIRIDQEILPIIMEQIISETVGSNTHATITEILQDPLRVFYTVGLDSNILLPNGEIDLAKLRGYGLVDDASGTVSFYSNRFGGMNTAESGKGDAHVGFQPSARNRYYYHQENQGIFTAITDKNGNPVTIPENQEYGIVWNANAYDLSWMTFAQYQSMGDQDTVYTYVTYYHPTPSAADAADVAEEVTYLVYTQWQYLKESVAFYDNASKTYLNGGVAIAPEGVEAAVAGYDVSQLYAVLGVGSLRTSRLHNMTVEKTANTTQTALQRYTPEYTYDTASDHNGNDVVVWLGNNGKLTVNIDTGIALTKQVTEPIGNESDTYGLTVTVPQGVTATPKVVDTLGNDVTAQLSTWTGNILTVNLKAGQTVYISGIPGGTQCLIGENIPSASDFYIAAQTQTVTVPTVSQAISGAAQFAPASVTNAPYAYGDLNITKELESDHAIPESIAQTLFRINLSFGEAFAGQSFTLAKEDPDDPLGQLTSQITLDAQGNVQLDILASQTLKILRLPAGTAVTVTETDPGAHFAVSYRTRNHSGEAADSDNALVIPRNGSATAVILNRYIPAPTSVALDIAGQKEFIAEGEHPGGSFQFLVQKWNGASWEDMTEKTASVTYTPNASGIQSFSIADVLSGIVYTEEGSHSYRILEVVGDVENVTYDRTLYTFDVVVTDNGGQLVAQVTDPSGNAIEGAYAVSFRNTWHTAPVSIDIDKLVDNRSGDSTVSKAGFQFLAVPTDEAFLPLEGGTPLAVISDAAGKARLTATYTAPGTYCYLLSEAAGAAPGWSYSQAQYLVTVTVTEDNGDLTAALTIEKQNSQDAAELATVDAEDPSKGSVSFRNTYAPQNATVDLDAAVIKELTGKALEKDAFTFYVCPDGQTEAVRSGAVNPVLIGKNELNGDVRFVDFEGALLFREAGIYRYDIIEAIPAEAVLDAATGTYFYQGMYYDATIYDLVVEIRNDSTTGTLKASYYFEDAVGRVVTYRNRYAPVATYHAIGGQKLLHGRAPRNGEFTFELYQGDTRLQTVTNKADGSFTFQPIHYTQPGTYTYTVREAAGSSPGVRYDGVNRPVTVTVTVTDAGGILHASATPNATALHFENTYTAAPALVSFLGSKTLKGGTLEDNSFTFQLYRTDSSFNTATGTLVATTQNVDGAFSFARSLSQTGSYFFVVKEDTSAPSANTVYDRTEYRFSVQVTDPGDGQLLAALTSLHSGVTTPAAPSVSGNVAFVNATFDEAVEKEVYLFDNTETHIDGKRVEAGDILTYFITYTNYTGEDVVANIVDTIPQHTSFVAGSASHGGSFVGTHVSWILDVARGESVKVFFQVKVNENNSIVANTAHIRDGVNTYSTNEVVNHTVTDPLVKDVFYPTDVTASIDGRKVYEGDTLLYKISFTNTSTRPMDVTVWDTIPVNTTFVEGSADRSGTYRDGVVTWELTQIPAWKTVTVSFCVTVNTGIGAVNIPNQATAGDGENTFKTEWVSNYTVEDEAEKDVFLSEAPTVSIDGKKVYAGETLVYTIRYRNTAREAATVTVTDTVPAHTTFVEGSASHGGVYEEGVVTWELEVPAGEEVTVSFQVTVNADVGQNPVVNTAQVLEGRNRYETNAVFNHTVDDEVEKDVFSAKDLTVSIDGNAVNRGDTLVYAISYRNKASAKATVTITDTIPENTTFVEGSASHEGVYADGVITWVLDVEAGQGVTVSFRVAVTGSGQQAKNKATVLVGRNAYTTNEVVNPIRIPDPITPPTGDQTDLMLLFVLLLTSGTGLLGIVLYSRKRKQR